MDFDKLRLIQYKPAPGELPTEFSTPAGPAPAGLTDSGKAIGGAGIQGAGQAFSMIMNALAQKQALEARADMNAKDITSAEKITHGKLAQQDADYNANQRVAAVRNFLSVLQNARAIDSGAVGNDTKASSGLSSGIMQAFKQGK